MKLSALTGHAAADEPSGSSCDDQAPMACLEHAAGCSPPARRNDCTLLPAVGMAHGTTTVAARPMLFRKRSRASDSDVDHDEQDLDNDSDNALMQCKGGRPVSHRSVEKRRRDRINSLIETLASCVPPCSAKYATTNSQGVRRPKHTVLSDTLALLGRLRKALAASEQHVAHLRAEAKDHPQQQEAAAQLDSTGGAMQQAGRAGKKAMTERFSSKGKPASRPKPQRAPDPKGRRGGRSSAPSAAITAQQQLPPTQSMMMPALPAPCDRSIGAVYIKSEAPQAAAAAPAGFACNTSAALHAALGDTSCTLGAAGAFGSGRMSPAEGMGDVMSLHFPNAMFQAPASWHPHGPRQGMPVACNVCPSIPALFFGEEDEDCVRDGSYAPVVPSWLELEPCEVNAGTSAAPTMGGYVKMEDAF